MRPKPDSRSAGASTHCCVHAYWQSRCFVIHPFIVHVPVLLLPFEVPMDVAQRLDKSRPPGSLEPFNGLRIRCLEQSRPCLLWPAG